MELTEGAFHDKSDLMTASAQQFGPVPVPAVGFARHIVLLIEATGGVAGGATVAAHEDAPWSCLQSVQLTDTNGAPIFGPLDGYDVYLANKWGAYNFLTDPKSSPVYSAVASTGNFAFLLRIPIEIGNRDGLGALPNQNAANTFQVAYTLSPSASVYTTAPDTKPAVRRRFYLEAWSQPGAVDLAGRQQEQQPPAVGTTQFWRREQHPINSGEQTIRLTRMGNLIRGLIFIFRNDSSPSVRNSTEWPDPARLTLDSRQVQNLSSSVWKHFMAERYGFDGAAAAANGLDTGVFVWDFIHDFDGKAGAELRDQYLATTQATRLELSGSFGGGGTLTVLYNDVAPGAGSIEIN